jgi:hypothetical protein
MLEVNPGKPRRTLILMQKAGRIRPFVLALIILVSGLILQKSWWQVGLVIMIVLFVQAFYRYRSLDQ